MNRRTIWKDYQMQLSLINNMTHARSIQLFTIHSTLLSRFTFPVTRCSQDQFTLKHHGNAESLASCAKQYLSRLTTLSMRQVMLVKGRTPHHYFQNHELGETCVHLHADNCSGQNKNNCFLWYLAWRAINQLHDSNTYSFLIAGHTKFGPDCSFGIIKRSYKATYISSLYEFTEMVESSSTAGVNKAQLVGTHDGKVIMPVHDWSVFLGQYFVKLPGIKKFHHFRFSKEEPGKLYFKEYSTSPEQSILLLKHPATLPPAVLPAKLNSQGLSQERKQYLHREIPQFCKPGTEDLVAPAP